MQTLVKRRGLLYTQFSVCSGQLAVKELQTDNCPLQTDNRKLKRYERRTEC
jgi:hypothetical protein